MVNKLIIHAVRREGNKIKAFVKPQKVKGTISRAGTPHEIDICTYVTYTTTKEGKMGQDTLQERLGKKIFGMAEMRTRQAEVMDLVSNHYETVFLRDNKRCACSRSALLIHPELVNVLLTRWEFEPRILEEKEKYILNLEEIGAKGEGSDKKEALLHFLDDILDHTKAYFAEMDLHARLPETRDRYPWFLKILNCQSLAQVINTVNLTGFAPDIEE
jgi:hypothetical protein